MNYMEKDSKIYISGHTGLVGSALKANLEANGYHHLLLRSRAQLDLTDQQATEAFFATERPEYVFLAAARVGGIHANNTYRGEFIMENLQIQNHIIHFAWKYGVKKLLFLGSSCIYPKNAPQPLREEYLLSGELEYTNEPYALAKIAGIITCESYNLQYGTNFISVMPTNLYGPGDNYDLRNSHVLPGMLRKMHLAVALENNDIESIRHDFRSLPVTEITFESADTEILSFLKAQGIDRDADGSVTLNLWGSGNPLREFLHVTDMVAACVFIMERIDFADLIPVGEKDVRKTHINIGSGNEITIRELAELIRKITGFRGKIGFDSTQPDGTLRKFLDSSKLNSLGWKATIGLEDGIRMEYDGYRKHQSAFR
jgi:GDP-L-fucose synthase